MINEPDSDNAVEVLKFHRKLEELLVRHADKDLSASDLVDRTMELIETLVSSTGVYIGE